MFIRVKLLPLVGILLPFALLLEGCLAVAWFGAVGIDTTRSSEVEFQPFENSWLIPPENRQQLGSVTSIAVAPFLESSPTAGRMEERWTSLLQQATDLHVVGPSEVAKQMHLSMLTMLIPSSTDQDEIGLAPRISAALQVNCVLFGRIVEEQQEKSLGGLKEKYSKRLYLYLVNADGRLMWKDELPFMLIKGTKDLNELDEAWARRTLKMHVLAHVQELGLPELGSLFKNSDGQEILGATGNPDRLAMR